MGSLSNLTAWGYESYMDGSSAVQFHASARLVLAGNLFSFNQLVFDSAFTSANTWEQNTITDSSLVWLSRAVTIGATIYGGNTGTQAIQSNPMALGTLKGLLDSGGNSTAVYGFNIGAGSGVNGTWTGAADTLSYRFGTGPVQTYNFEAVPEPASMAALGMGALALLRRRKKS
ncbi:MAG: PEP-CTERM sorting domain-containing protein [Armatimonadota bacterium]